MSLFSLRNRIVQLYTLEGVFKLVDAKDCQMSDSFLFTWNPLLKIPDMPKFDDPFAKIWRHIYKVWENSKSDITNKVIFK